MKLTPESWRKTRRPSGSRIFERAQFKEREKKRRRKQIVDDYREFVRFAAL